MDHSITVIIADDETTIRNGLEEIILNSELNIRVLVTVDNGKDALSLIMQYKPDIAIMDINMPELFGLEVIRRIRENGMNTYFFILSGYNDFSYAQKAITYGVKSYFLKPLDIPAFLQELDKYSQEILLKRHSIQNVSSQNFSSLVDSSRILFLNQLIQSQIYSDDSINDKLSLLNLRLENSKSCVVIYSFHSKSGIELSSLETILNQSIEPLLQDYHEASWVYNNNQIISIINISDYADHHFRALLNQCIETITQDTGYNLLIGIGSVVDSLTQCFYSYSQAHEALSYHIFDTDIKIYDTTIISHQKPTFSQENIDFKPIIYYISRNNISGIEEYCHTFFASLLFIKMPQPNFVFAMCMYLIMNVQKQIALLYPDKKIEFEFSFEEIISYESIAYLKKWLIDFFTHYSDLLKDSNENSDTIIKMAKKYIHDHLNHNIKTKDIATQVNLSESYFAIYFKNKTGINLRDYILKAKIDYAKQLLRQKQNNISEIAYLTGYQDYRSFSRAFKNETGMSPTEYINHPDNTL